MAFNRSNWERPQWLTVLGVQDDDGHDETGTITHTVNGAGLSGTAAVTTNVTDDDELGLVFGRTVTYNSADSVYEMSVNERQSTSFRVSLDTEPYPADQNVTFSMSVPVDSGVDLKKTGSSTGTSNLSLTFTASDWNQAQTVIISAGDDDDSEDTVHTITFGLSGADYGNLDPSDLKLTVVDDDTPGLIFAPNEVSATETDTETTASYRVRLASLPSASVTVTLAQPTNSDVTIDTDTDTMGDQNTLTFSTSNWRSLADSHGENRSGRRCSR